MSEVTKTEKARYLKGLILGGLLLLLTISLVYATTFVTNTESDFDAGSIDITVIDIQSYPTLGSNWTVRFTTTSTADLTITAVNGTDFDIDLEFLELTCGNVLTTDLIDGNIFVENYNCGEIGYVTSKVLTTGKHTLKFVFGDDVEYAYNVVAEPGGEVDLRPQACAAEDLEVTKGTFADACDGTYPAACGAGNDLLSCDDNLLETHETSTTAYASARINVTNTSVIDCGEITDVFVCYEWWRGGGNYQDCDISVDNDGGASYVAVTTTCPGNDANPGVTCTNVTSLEDWSCSDFFGTNATGALIKSEALKDGGANDNITWDVLFFNVTYTKETTPPALDIQLPANNSFFNTTSISLNYTVSDNVAVDTCILTNTTGQNVTLAGCANTTITGIANRQNNITVYANDTSNNFNSSQVFFTVDTVVPNVTLNSPSNDTTILTPNITFNFTATDNLNISFGCSIYLDGILNQTNSSTQNNTLTNFIINNISQGSHNWSVSCDDGANTAFSDTRIFFVNVTPILSSISDSSDPIKGGEVINITPSGVADPNNDTLNFYCSESSTTPNSSNTDCSQGDTLYSSPYSTMTCSFTTATDDTTHTVYCRVFDGVYYSDTSNTTFTTDSTPPTFVNIINDPSSEDDLDPGFNITVTANISDPLGIGEAILQYKLAIAENWTNASMDNATGLWKANFTPSEAGNYSYQVWSNDTVGNVNISSITNLSVFLDWTWYVNRSELDLTVAGILESNKEIGNITINNTGDHSLSFLVTDDSPYGGFGLTFDGVGSAAFNLDSNTTTKEIKILRINATFGSIIREDLVVIKVKAFPSVNATPPNTTINVTLASFTGGPYFDVVIDTFSANIDQSQNMNLGAFLKNIGNETATDIWFNWSLPDGWTNSSGNLSYYVGNLTPDSTTRNDLNASITASASAGVATITANASSAQNVTDSDSKLVTVNCNNDDGVCGAGCSSATDNNCPVQVVEVGGGAGGGGAIISEVAIEEKPLILQLQTNETFELVRGEDNTFPISVTNPFEDSVLDNVTLKITGFLIRYIKISPDMLEGIGFNETKLFNVTILAPAYTTTGEFSLNFTITGLIVKGNETDEFVETRIVTLIVRALSREDVVIKLDEGEKTINMLLEEGFGVNRVNKLLNRARRFFERRDYEGVVSIIEEIEAIKEAAFESSDLIKDVRGKIAFAEISFLEVPETRKLFHLALAAFEREDYETARQRALDAQLIFAAETRGKFNIVKVILDYWSLILLVIVISSISGVIAHRKRIVKKLNKKLKDLNVEESTMHFMIKDVEKKAFVDKTIGMETYGEVVRKCEARLAEIKQLRTKLRTKRRGIIKLSSELDILKKEFDELMKMADEVEDSYFKKGIISKETYDKRIEQYRIRKIDLEKEIAVLEAKIGKKPMEKKEEKFIRILILPIERIVRFFESLLRRGKKIEKEVLGEEREEGKIKKRKPEGVSLFEIEKTEVEKKKKPGMKKVALFGLKESKKEKKKVKRAVREIMEKLKEKEIAGKGEKIEKEEPEAEKVSQIKEPEEEKTKAKRKKSKRKWGKRRRR